MAREQVSAPVADIAIDRLEGALGIRVAGPIATILQVGLQVQTLVPSGQEKPDQQATEGHHQHEQTFLEIEERIVARRAQVENFLDGLSHLDLDRSTSNWTGYLGLSIVNLHGADSEPRFVTNGKDMLHLSFQLRPGSLMALPTVHFADEVRRKGRILRELLRSWPSLPCSESGCTRFNSSSLKLWG